jgi:hypothetical protein
LKEAQPAERIDSVVEASMQATAQLPQAAISR